MTRKRPWVTVCTRGAGEHVEGQLLAFSLRLVLNRPGLTSDERERLKTLERENRELRRANEILKSAAASGGAGRTERSSRRLNIRQDGEVEVRLR